MPSKTFVMDLKKLPDHFKTIPVASRRLSTSLARTGSSERGGTSANTSAVMFTPSDITTYIWKARLNPLYRIVFP